MSKIKVVGNGFVQIDDSLINLTQFGNISRYQFGHGEDPDGKLAYGILATPLRPSTEDVENGVDGGTLISTYGNDEEDAFEADFAKVVEALTTK